MADQTRPEIAEIQLKNKAIKYKKEQEEMRNESAYFVFNCDVKQLGEVYALIKKLKKNSA